MSPNAALQKAELDRGVMENDVTRLETKVSSNPTPPFCLQQITSLIKKMEAYRSETRDIHIRILQQGPSDVEPHQQIYEKLTDKLDAIEVELLKLKSTSSAQEISLPSKPQLPNIKLPEIKLPTFSGNYEDWPSFQDLFTATVIKNSTISDAHRLQYLISQTTGEANSLVKTFTVTNENFREAWNLLEAKYKNTREIVTSLVRKLLQQRQMKSANASDMQTLLNTTQESLRSLKVLGRDVDHWDDIIVVTTIDKLDPETKSEWAKQLTGTTPSTFKDVEEFLQKQVRSLTARGAISTAFQTRSQHPHMGKVKSHHVTPQSSSCSLCKGVHPLYKCPQLAQTPQNERLQLVQSRTSACINCLSSSHQLRNCSSPHTCRKCNQRHNTFLHPESASGSNGNVTAGPASSSSAPRSHHVVSEATAGTTVLLKTAIVTIRNQSNVPLPCRALLDDGSEASFITESCAKALGLNLTKADVVAQGLGGSESTRATHSASVRIESTVYNAYIETEVLVVKKVTGTIPQVQCSSSWSHIESLKLADPTFNQPGKIDLLLGADVIASISRDGLRHGPRHSPTAIHTAFGWVLFGRVTTLQSDVVNVHHITCSLEEIAQRMWTVEEPRRPSPYTREEKQCEAHFLSTVTRASNGQFVVRLPLRKFPDKPTIDDLGDTRELALKRFLGLERRFRKNPSNKEKYLEFMREYIQLGHMTKVTSTHTPGRLYFYIPHHYVVNEASTTTSQRSVFDASMKSTSGVSLNDTMLVGPTVQSDLFSILLRFRMNPIAVKGDIAKMYRQFLLHPAERDLQRILWREDPSQPIEEYQLNTVTYGTASAPYLATRCLLKLVEDEGDKFPTAAAALKSATYVDDLLKSIKSEDDAVELVQQLMGILSTAGLTMRKWSSNSKRVIDSIPEELHDKVDMTSFDDDNFVKALGLVWQPTSDSFTFLTKTKSEVNTKRDLLSEISKTFDPLGWLSPLTISAKILFQDSWRLKQGWDDSLTPHQKDSWAEHQLQLPLLSSFKIPRCVVPFGHDIITLVGFSDASEKAYAASVYLVTRDSESSVKSSHLIASRSKVAPINHTSLPRLELCAAVLLCDLIEDVSQALNITCEIKCYTDSMIVLKWIQSPSRKWKTYVANRVSSIQEVIPADQWSHVRSEDNPADLPSRGISIATLVNSSLWWHGPDWIISGNTPDPAAVDLNLDQVKAEEKSTVLTHFVSSELPWALKFIQHFSTLRHLVSTTAVLRKFITWLLSKKTSVSHVSVKDRRQAKFKLIQLSQQWYFKDDLARLSKGKEVKTTSKLLPLDPKIDNGLLKVGGRLQRSKLPLSKQHPTLLHKKCPLTELIVRECHLINLHATISLTTASVNQQYWIIGGKSYIRYLIRECYVCKKVRATTMQQQMGPLPVARVTQLRPFLHSGVDFAGPFFIKFNQGQRAKPSKYYFSIFVCMSTKAVHLESVSSLSTEAFIAAFRRFVARRGLCSNLYSDCGTNFKGAEKELRQLRLQLEDQLQQPLSHLGTDFHFNVPAAPNQGGLWEAGVKAVKHHLRRVVGDHVITLECFNTVLCQIEAILNSRPLCATSNDPSDMEPLTPGHFLIHGPLNAVPDPDLQLLPQNRLSQWQDVQRIVQHVWTRWKNEFIVSLQQRAKWRRKEKNLQINDLVLVTAENTSPTTWKCGRVIELHISNDGLVRSATIRTVANPNTTPVQFSDIKRPVNKLALLLSD